MIPKRSATQSTGALCGAFQNSSYCHESVRIRIVPSSSFKKEVQHKIYNSLHPEICPSAQYLSVSWNQRDIRWRVVANDISPSTMNGALKYRETNISQIGRVGSEVRISLMFNRASLPGARLRSDCPLPLSFIGSLSEKGSTVDKLSRTSLISSNIEDQ
jgi:hypothetical protein